MRKIVIFLHTGYCGSDEVLFYKVPKDTPDEVINRFCHELAITNAESYGIYPEEDNPCDEDLDDGNDYSSNIEGCFVDYDPVKHDKYIVNGNIPHWDEF